MVLIVRLPRQAMNIDIFSCQRVVVEACALKEKRLEHHRKMSVSRSRRNRDVDKGDRLGEGMSDKRPQTEKPGCFLRLMDLPARS